MKLFTYTLISWSCLRDDIRDVYSIPPRRIWDTFPAAYRHCLDELNEYIDKEITEALQELPLVGGMVGEDQKSWTCKIDVEGDEYEIEIYEMELQT